MNDTSVGLDSFFLLVDFLGLIYVLADLAEWLECLTANAKDATVLSSISASSGTVESEWRQMKQCWFKI